jgi:hypothetical protein
MTELDPRVERAISRWRQLPEPSADALSRLHTALLQPDTSANDHAWLVLTRAQAAAWLLLLVLSTSAVWYLAGPRIPRPRNADAESVPVQFVFVVHAAREVSLVGDFNDWDASVTRLSRGEGGVWSVVVPLKPGRFAYSYVVDGVAWYADPEAHVMSNDFGRPSSIVHVERSERM